MEYSGYALCANICYESKEGTPRKTRGSPADKTHFENVFKRKFKFETKYLIEEDGNYITKKIFQDALDAAIGIVKQKRYTLLAVVICSHGHESEADRSESKPDGQLQQHVSFYDCTSTIEEVLLQKLRHSDLDQMNKILLLEMCRISNQSNPFDDGIEIQHVDDLAEETFGPQVEPRSQQQESEMIYCPLVCPWKCIVLFGSPSGMYSFTHPDHGSRTLYALKEATKEKENGLISVLKLMTEVIRRMSKEILNVDDNGRERMASNNGCIIHRLTDDIKLEIFRSPE